MDHSKKLLFLLTVAVANSDAKVAYEPKVDYASTNTYKGEKISPESLTRLAPKPPVHLVEKAQRFLRDNPELAQHLSGLQAFGSSAQWPTPPIAGDIEIRRAYFRHIKDAFAQAGYPTLSHSVNWVLKMDDFWLLKAAGEPNRHENLNGFFRPKYENQVYGAPITEELLQEFNTTCGVTYQTISRVAYYLRALEVIKEEGLSIKVPDSYLIHIPGRPFDICDANYIVAEACVQGTTTYLEDHPKAVEEITILDLVKLIGYTALWNHTKNILVDENGDVHYIDMEQPNVHSPADFFHENVAVHRSNVHHGWSELKNQIILTYAKEHNISVEELLEKMKNIQDIITDTWKD